MKEYDGIGEEGQIVEENHCKFLLAQMEKMENLTEECMEKRSKLLQKNVLSHTSPYLFPFVIVYSLIGASVAYKMLKHIGHK